MYLVIHLKRTIKLLHVNISHFFFLNSCIKRNKTQSLVVMRMNPRSVMQSKSERKNECRTIMHMCGIQKDGPDDPACRQEQTWRRREQSRGRGARPGAGGTQREGAVRNTHGRADRGRLGQLAGGSAGGSACPRGLGDRKVGGRPKAGDVCMYTTHSQRSTEENNTTL